MNMITPHNEAKKEDIAKTVIMPGDPKRSGFIAENFLKKARLVNDIRGAQGYTGRYKGCDLTVMSSGMGIPSMGLYSHELFSMYDVDNIIRVGTTGSISENIKTRDIIIVEKAFTNSVFYKQLGFKDDYLARADECLLEFSCQKADEMKMPYHKGAVLTMELYYSMQQDIVGFWQKKGALGFEMETACLYAYADYHKKRALSILSVSNNILTGEEMEPKDRENTFFDMISLALEVAVNL